MKRSWKILISVAAVAVLASLAFAHGRHGHRGMHGAWFKEHVGEKVDDALDAAKATPAQRNAIHASLDHVFDTVAAGQEAGGRAMAGAIQLFSADKIDQAAVAQHRAQKEAQVQKIGDAVVQFVHDAHDALTAPQRQQVIAFVKQEKAEHGAGNGFRERMMGAMIQTGVDSVLDELKATPEQRTAINAAKDRVVAAFKTGHADKGADLEQLLGLFAADKLDNAKIDALRTDHMQRMRKIADAVIQSITDVHDVLSADQRAQLIAFVKAHHPHHRG